MLTMSLKGSKKHVHIDVCVSGEKEIQRTANAHDKRNLINFNKQSVVDPVECWTKSTVSTASAVTVALTIPIKMRCSSLKLLLMAEIYVKIFVILSH